MASMIPAPLEPDWEALLLRAAGRRVDPHALAVMIQRLSRRYLGEPVTLARSDELLARTLFWFPRDVHKVARPIAELVHALPSRPLQVLDVGAGTGATSLGTVRALAQQAALGATVPPLQRIVAVDTDIEALAILRRIADEARVAGLLPALPPLLETRAGDLRDPKGFGPAPANGYDLVLLGSVLVEVTRSLGDETARGAAMAEHIARLIDLAPLAPDGAMIIIEPATRPEARALQHARNHLLARGYGIFAPCTHPQDCPMLARARDWCHEDLPVDLPPWLVSVARAAGLRWQGLTFSYLVVRRDATRSVRDLLSPSERTVVPARLVSSPRVSKGKTEAFACGPFPGPTRGPRIMQLDRDIPRTPAEGIILAECTRGDVIGIHPSAAARACEGKPIRVAPTDMVRGT